MTTKITVGFQTICWEKDWQFLLKTRRLQLMAERNLFNFDKRIVFINNVNDETSVRKQLDKHVNAGRLTEYYMVEDYAKDALEFFALSKQQLGKGYYYSISELVSLYLNLCDYTVHYCADSIPEKPTEWIPGSLERMQLDDKIKVANLMWELGDSHNAWDIARENLVSEDDKWLVGRSRFSDQCYLIKNEDFRSRIYHEHHPSSDAYPSYAGESFEKRVNSWLRHHDYYRLIFKKGQYIHRNFPNNPLKHKWFLLSGKYNR